MHPLPVVVILERIQFSFEIACVPKGHMVKIFAPDCPDQAFHDGVRERYIRNRLHLLHPENPQIGFPAMVFKQGIVVGTQVGWRSRAEISVTKHPAGRRTIWRAATHGKSDDPPRALVHDGHHPVRPEDQRLTAKQVDAPETVLAVTEKCQPGWTPGAWVWPVVPGQSAAHQVFVHGDIESQGHLIRDPLVAEARIPSLHLHDGGNQLGRRALWPRSSASFG